MTQQTDLDADICTKKCEATPMLVKPTKRRYITLLLYCLATMSNGFQWIEYSSISNVATNFYNVDNLALNWTSTIYMLVFVLFSLPASVWCEQIGLATSVKLGTCGTCLAAIVKCFSGSPGSFWVLVAGQLIAAFSQLFLLSAPPKLAAVWFPDSQVSLATAVGVFGNQFGIALGFALPSLVLALSASPAAGLAALNTGTAAVNLTTLALILLLLDEAPKHAPGSARLAQLCSRTKLEGQQKHGALIDLLRKRSFVLLLLSYGLVVGTSYAPLTILNQMMRPTLDGATTAIEPSSSATAALVVGTVGLVVIVSGMFGAIGAASVLDATHCYKPLVVTLLFCTAASMAGLGLAIETRCLSVIYVFAAMFGFFVTGYLAIGFEVAIEICYPRPELPVTNLMNLTPQIFGFVVTFVSSALVDELGTRAVTALFTSLFLVGLALAVCTKLNLKRQQTVQAYRASH